MNPTPPRVLLIGYGNPGRLDDGLGVAVAEALANDAIPGLTVESNYQLTVEDAEAVARYDVAVFADAAVAGPEPFAFEIVRPRADAGVSTHSVEPAAVLELARDLFGARTAAHLLAVRGYRFDGFGQHLSNPARANLAAAVRFLRDWFAALAPDGLTVEGDRPEPATVEDPT